MAHWISSKLKAAETLLQQIDQQAAESLRKHEKPLPDDILDGESTLRTPESKTLIKDQLKKKSLENVVNQSIINIDKQNSKVISRSNSVLNQDDKTGVSLNLNSKLDMSRRLTDSDWTELLSVPDKKGVSGGGSVSWSIRAFRKDGKKVGTSGPGMNLSLVDGRGKMVQNNGVSESFWNSSVKLENSTSADSDQKASSVGDATPRTSSVQSPNSGDESNQRKDGSTRVISNTNLVNMGRAEGVSDTVDGEKVHSSNASEHSSQVMPILQEKELGRKDSVRLKRESASNRSTLGSRTSSSGKMVSSSPSDSESNSENGTSSSEDSQSEREKEERRKRRQQILEERAAAKAGEAIKERENLVARLEGEKQSSEKILEERVKHHIQEASELQTTMMETMEAVELEKQKHNNTRMEALARLAELESANVNLTRSLANVQKNLQVEVGRTAELRQQIHIKEATHEELRRKISSIHQNDEKLRAPKSVEFGLEMLEAEYSFINDKVGRMQDKAKTLETSIETTRRELENPTEVEIELKWRLHQFTDHLIQKQAQVETLSSEKAILLLRVEAVSRMLNEYKPTNDSAEYPPTSSRDDLESGVLWQISNSKLRSLFKGRMQSGQRHLGSMVRQLDSRFCAGAMFLRRNSAARKWSIVYLVFLHLWVMYILMSHSPVSDDRPSGAVFSLENISNTGGV